jgi:hypothetical protein
MATGCEGVGMEAQAPQRSASFGVSHDQAAFLLGFCRNLVSSTSPETKSGGQADLFKYATHPPLRFRWVSWLKKVCLAALAGLRLEVTSCSTSPSTPRH